MIKRIGAVLAALLIGAVLLFLWASSGRLSQSELAQTKDYQGEPASPDRDTFTVMTYNLGYLSGRSNNEPVVRSDSLFHANMDQALNIIRRANPDILALQEVDFGAARSFYAHQLDTLATRLGYTAGAQAVNWDERYLPFPYGRPAVHFGRVLSGQALLSRYPIRRHKRVELPRPPRSFLTDAFYLDRLAQISVVGIGGWPLVIINVHLEAFDTETREKQAQRVRDLYLHFAKQGFAVLVLGDFNSITPSAKMALSSTNGGEFAGDETMATLLKTDLNPAFSEGAYVTGRSVNTFPAHNPTRKIDHILYRPRHIVPVDAKIWCGDAEAPPSDHCAVSMSFILPRPKDMLPQEKIPEDKLPSLDSILAQ